MTLSHGAVLVMLCSLPCLAQRYGLNIDPNTVPGVLLEHISLDHTDDEEQALLEQFARRFPDDPALPWVYDKMRSIYAERNEPAKALGAADRLLQVEPDDIHAAYESLKLAQMLHDEAAVRRWTERCTVISRRLLASSSPSDAGRARVWAERVGVAREVAGQMEYATVKKILDTPDPEARLAAVEDYLQRTPHSRYAPQLLSQSLAAVRNLGDERAFGSAERLLRRDPGNADLLLAVTDYYFRKQTNPDKVLANATRLVQLMKSSVQPGELSDMEWARKKASILGSAYWMTGSICLDRSRYAPADKALRAALPYLSRDPEASAAVLFYLGWANYNLKNLSDALRFSRQCVALKSSFQAQAARNLAVIQKESQGR